LRRRWRSSRYANGPWRSIVADKKNDYKAAEDKLNKERATLVAFDNELNDLDKDIKIKKKEIVDSELGLKKAEHDTSLIAKERSSLEVMKENLEKQFTWILEEKQWVLIICVRRRWRCSFFGKAGSPYDFNGVNLGHAREQCRELESQQKGMGKKINTKVMNMIDKWVHP
jgi:structural maintenance of chromosome 2